MKESNFASFKGFARLALLCLSLIALFSGSLLAQERTGALQGNITDASGAAIPNASVEIMGPAIIQPMKTTTDAGGGFLYPFVPNGIYTITVTAKGFATTKRTDARVDIARQSRVDIKMEVGQVTESVTITSESAIVDTATTVVATNISQNVYDHLPKGRSFDSLLVMAPGTRQENKGGGFQVDGASGSENIFVIDGVEANNMQTGTLVRQSQIPIEFIGETTLKSSGVDAQFGGAIGGVVGASTKSGANDFHGSGDFYWINDSFDASPRSSLQLNLANDNIAEYFVNKKDNYNYLNPGFTLGGPIKRNSLWFFVGLMPEFNKTERTVTFTTGQTGTYESKTRQDFTQARVDWAPFQSLRVTGGYLYNPYKVNGLLPARNGSDSYANPWSQRGSRQPYTGYNYQVDWTASSKFVISGFGGYNYRNNKDYGIPAGTRYFYIASSVGLPGVPANVQGQTGNFTPNNQQTTKDTFERNNLNIVGSWLLNAGGQHSFKFGWNMNNLKNSPLAGAWPDGYIRVGWNRGYTAVTKPNPSGGYRGTYGYYINRAFATTGDVSSLNQGIFFQDNWRMNKFLTLNLGIRSERENVPAYSGGAGSSKAIVFGFGQKWAPRLGFAYDPSGKGKQKIYGSWGWYYDIMKYELPRGSFGGDQWLDNVYTLDDPNIFNIKVAPGSGGFSGGTFPGTFIEQVNWRIPSNDPSNSLIDPDLMPVRQSAFDFGYEYSINPMMVLGARYTHKQLDRTIEDVGILTPEGEQYYITNPGYGYSIDSKKFPAGYPAAVTPKAKRQYDGLEISFTKRFSGSWAISSSYVWSRLYGNYAGLASSDEDGRTSPNVNRYFDEAWMSYDKRGQLIYGRLATDRPHTLKVFANKDLKSKIGLSRFSVVYQLYSGTPLTTEVSTQAVPSFVNGRGDIGRTPVFNQANFLFFQDLPGFTESQKFRFEVNITNLFNTNTPTDAFKTYTHANDGSITWDNTADIFKGYDYIARMKAAQIRVDPRFWWDSAYQNPRTIRLGFHFIF